MVFSRPDATVLSLNHWPEFRGPPQFVVAAGNLPKPPLGDEERLINDYPGLLLEEGSRITDPASAALAITVGGISGGLTGNSRTDESVNRLVSGRELYPSPFTRTGAGLNGAIKPELVEEAGDYYVDGTKVLRSVGVLTANRSYVTGTLLKSWEGTSFAAPKVANIAAQLTQKYPDYSSNLIRALLIHSARLPDVRPDLLANATQNSAECRRIYGYGRPDLGRALQAAGNDAWLVCDGTIDVDTFRIFELPALPEEFVTRRGNRHIAITLAFDPPTRASRADNYLGVTMEFALWRNIDVETLRETYRRWDRDEKEELDEDAAPPGLGDIKKLQIKLLPKAGVRKTSTVQNAKTEIKRGGSYSAGSSLFLVLICQRKWAPANIENQRFGVVMSLFHEDESVDLEAQLRIQLEIRGRVRV